MNPNDHPQKAGIVLDLSKGGTLEKCLTGLGVVVAFLPAFWVLTHPLPVAWLRPLCKETWPVLAVGALAAVLPLVVRRRGWCGSLLIILLTQAIFQAWCYNTGSHPARNPQCLWGILPQTDSHLYYTQACEFLNGQQIVSFGARHSYPIYLATLLRICGRDFRLVMSLSTILTALATWAAFEVVRRRLGALAAAVYLACVTCYIRIYCTGVFMTEQLGMFLGLCAAALLVESLGREGRSKTYLWCGGLFCLTEALNARPDAYMTLPLLALAGWPLFPGDLRAKGKAVGWGSMAVALAFICHGLTYNRAVASPKMPSNAWYCIYGMLHGGNWQDGVKHYHELTNNLNSSPVATDKDTPASVQASYNLRDECLSEIAHHPSELFRGWERALRFAWWANIPFRAIYPVMPSVWFTESARWAALLGLFLSGYLLCRGPLAPPLVIYQRLAWLVLAAIGGIVLSFPFAPPWDGEMRLLGATLPLFYLLPSAGISIPYLLVVQKLRNRSLDLGRSTTALSSQRLPSLGTAAVLAGIVSMALAVGPWWLIDRRLLNKGRIHPVMLMVGQMIEGDSIGSFDLASFHTGYRIRLTDDDGPTWLPRISRSDFIRSIPRGIYLSLASQFKQLPAGTEIMTQPYGVLLVLSKSDSEAGKFTPRPDQIGRAVWPRVYFSKDLRSATP